MPTLKKTFIKRSRQLYSAILIPIILFIIVIFVVLSPIFFKMESERTDALTELYITKIGSVFQEIEELFNPELETLLTAEYHTLMDAQAIERIKSELNKIEYDTLEIDAINYYKFSDEFVIFDTDFELDKGLSFPNWPFLNETVWNAEPGSIFLQSLAKEGRTGLIRLYAYMRMPDDTIFEIGIRFKAIDDMINRLAIEVFNDSILDIRVFDDYSEAELYHFDESNLTGKPEYILINPFEGEYYISKNSTYGRYDIAIKMKVYFIGFLMIAAVIFTSLVLLTLYLMKHAVARLSGLLSKPILILENNMKYFNVQKKDYYVEEIESDIYELQSMQQSFVLMKDEIVNSYDELHAMNEELEDAYLENEALIEKVDNLIHIPDFLKYINNVEAFILKSFEKIHSLINSVDYAFAAVVEDDVYRYIGFKGFDMKFMNDLKLVVSDYSHAEKVVLQDYQPYEFVKEHDVPEINDKLSEIRQMISIPIKSREKMIAIIALFSKEEDKFSSDDFRIANYFLNYIKGYLTINELSEMEKDVQKETILGIIKLLEKHDPYTKGHSENVARLAASFAEFLELDEKLVQDIYWGGIVHDIGKIIIPHNILNKPSRLTEAEFERIKMHPEYAYEALKENTHMSAIAKMIKHHHERYDGTGYPDQLAGEAIPFVSRLLTIADSWDAMTSERVYKKGMPAEEAIQELIKFSGKQFDPDLVKEWVKFINHKK
jgi:HD-GYP domain-containing protein (c-di-GMP phosphodiesterase class II)